MYIEGITRNPKKVEADFHKENPHRLYESIGLYLCIIPALETSRLNRRKADSMCSFSPTRGCGSNGYCWRSRQRFLARWVSSAMKRLRAFWAALYPGARSLT